MSYMSFIVTRSLFNQLEEDNEREERKEEARHSRLTMASTLSKYEAFREAAQEMADAIIPSTSSNMTSNISTIDVPEGILPFFAKSVPQEIKESACDYAQRNVRSAVKTILEDGLSDPKKIGIHGLYNYYRGNSYFNGDAGEKFMNGLDDSTIRAVAKTGIANLVISRLDQYEVGKRHSEETRQHHRACQAAFDRAKENAIWVCEQLKAPYENLVKAKSPVTPSNDY